MAKLSNAKLISKFRNLIISFVICNLAFVIFSPVIAQDMSSQNFKIQGGNFNLTAGSKSSQHYKLTDVVGQTAANVFTSKGYIINAGFLQSAGAAPFVFTVSPPVVDFGVLTPNMPIEKNLTIYISNGDVTGYSIKASENQPLETTAGAEIPDTVCDSSGNPCTQTQSARWTANNTYGFGYRMAGLTIPKDFNKEGYYRPFAASRRNESAITVMESQARKVKDTGLMTLRLNTSPSQPVGQYQNVISFIALAGI